MKKEMKVKSNSHRFYCILEAVDKEVSKFCTSYQWFICDESPNHKIRKLKKANNRVLTFSDYFARKYEGKYLYCQYEIQNGKKYKTEKMYIVDDICKMLERNKFTSIRFGKNQYDTPKRF